MEATDLKPNSQLSRGVNLPAAVFLGLGSIIGTGVFVTLGLAANLVGSAMLLALLIAAILATCNGLSTAQLAAACPNSGGSYEYGYVFLKPSLGVLAGVSFFLAKSASAATAAIGLGSYLSYTLALPLPAWTYSFAAILLLTFLASQGIKRSAWANFWIVLITISGLLIFIGVLAWQASTQGTQQIQLAELSFSWDRFMEATALLFVAYTGYGRVATLGEEIKDPKRNIPKAIVWTLAISFVLYLSLALVILLAIGAGNYAQLSIETAAPLLQISHELSFSWLAPLISIVAVTAMLGVLFNLILGLSRVVYAMALRRDLPASFAYVHPRSRIPLLATLATAAWIMVLTAIQDIRLTWSFSAFTVLVYYGITNLAALRLPPSKRLYPRVFAYFGLLSCGLLALAINLETLVTGLAVLLASLILWKLTKSAIKS